MRPDEGVPGPGPLLPSLGMELAHLDDAPGHDPDQPVVALLLARTQANVRVIRLASGQHLPEHAHGASELTLLVVEGTATLRTESGEQGDPAELSPGTLVSFDVGEVPLVANHGTDGLTLVAFFAPPFPAT